MSMFNGKHSSSSLGSFSSDRGSSFHLGDTVCEEDFSTSSDGSSPFTWPNSNSKSVSPSWDNNLTNNVFPEWDDNIIKHTNYLSEAETMKERFAKLLLGEDMSGSGRGACSALTLSNAITNLSASVFGELWRLEPLRPERRKMWQREMEWLLAVTDHIIELTPSIQQLPDGRNLEVMISRPRSDLYVNLPALRKLDTLLLEILDSFKDTEFWYVDQGIVAGNGKSNHDGKLFLVSEEHEEKWWLPSPKVPANGLSDNARKHLQKQRNRVSQVFKASLAINTQILSDMDVPDVYLEALPKSARATLGETIYRCITSGDFSTDAFFCSFDLSTDHRILEIVNRIEAAIHIWGRKSPRKHPSQMFSKDLRSNTKTTWGGLVKELGDMGRREDLVVTTRAHNLLLSLKQKSPGLPQTLLDITKIQFNKDVGKAIMESYSRVMESLAFNILARIDDVLHADDRTKYTSSLPTIKNMLKEESAFSICLNTPYGTPLSTPNASPTHQTLYNIPLGRTCLDSQNEDVDLISSCMAPELTTNAYYCCELEKIQHESSSSDETSSHGSYRFL